MVADVKIADIEWHDRIDGIALLETKSGNCYYAYFWGKEFVKGERVRVSFAHYEQAFSWQSTFESNITEEQKLLPGKEKASYTGYGKIISLDPIVADFGDIQLDIGRWSHDERIIGAYICWDIPRLELSLP